jgi:outer membrane protein OmpA-like peptidoglycan-associated protein
MLQLPLLLHYQTRAYRYTRRYYARAGLQLELPLSGRYQASAASVVNELYYPALGVALRDPAYKGLGVFSDVSSDVSLTLRPSLTAMAEAGVKWQLGARACLYVGLYAGYGVSSVVKPQSSGADVLLQGEAPPASFGTGGVPASRYAPATRLTDRAALFAAGVKVEVSISKLFIRLNTRMFWNVASATPQREASNLNLFKMKMLPKTTLQWRGLGELSQMKEMPSWSRIEAEIKEIETEQLRLQKEDELRQLVVDVRKRHEEKGDRCSELIAIMAKPLAFYTASQVDFSPAQQEDLKAKLALLKLNPSMRIACTGHSCDLGAPETKLRVSRRRVEMLKKYLVSNGVDESRVEIIGESDSAPIVPNTSERNRRINRRVEIAIIALTPPCVLLP